MKSLKKITLGVSLMAVMLTTGATAAFYANANSDEKTDGKGKSAVWDILTDNQKAQIADDAEQKLEQDLADGKITQEQYDKAIEVIQNGGIPFFGKCVHGRGELTDEQKAAMEENRSKWAEIKSNWDNLTDEQKSEIYDLEDEKTDIDKQIIEKYREFGVVDSETADSLKDELESKKSYMRENGQMPMCGDRGMCSDRGMGGGKEFHGGKDFQGDNDAQDGDDI